MFLTDALRAVADFKFYREVPQKGVALYLFFLGFVFATATTIAVHRKVTPFIEETIEWASKEMPVLTLANGKLSSSAAGLVRIQHPRVPQIAIVVDTTRTAPVTPADMAEQKAVAWLAESMMYLAPEPNKMETYDLSKTQNPKPVTLDPAFFKATGEMLPKVLYPLSFLITYAMFLVWKLIAALIYACFALLIGGGMQVVLPFGSMFKLAVYAQTPVILLQTVQLFLPTVIPMFWIVSLMVVGLYLWQALKQFKPEATPAA